MKPKSTPGIDRLNVGETILVGVRKVFQFKNRTAQNDPTVLQVEIAEKKRVNTVLGELNPNDDRIIKPGARRAWVNSDVEEFLKRFNVPVKYHDTIRNLQVSTRIPVEDQQPDVHFVTLDMPNPMLSGSRLRVQITETTQKPSEGAKNLINPSTGAPLLHNGQKIYQVSTVVKELIQVIDGVKREVSPNDTTLTRDVAGQTASNISRQVEPGRPAATGMQPAVS